MVSVQEVVVGIKALSEKPDTLPHLHKLLKRWKNDLRDQASVLPRYLDQLNPKKHSLGYLYLLELWSSGQFSNKQAGDFLQTVIDFINLCSAEQIRLAPVIFVSLCQKFKEQVMQLQVLMQGILALKTAIRKLQPSPKHSTPLHSDFLHLCILAKWYKGALLILDDDLFTLDGIIDFDQPEDPFLYYYYGGMVNIGLNRFPKAFELLHYAVNVRMPYLTKRSLIAQTVDADKKYILVSLIYKGKVHFYNTKSDIATRYVTGTIPGVEPYSKLATSYATKKISDLEDCIRANTEKFQSDNNCYLVEQVQASLYKRIIKGLVTQTRPALPLLYNSNIEGLPTQTRVTLPLHDIAKAVELKDPKDAEMHVLLMIEDKDIYATIDKKDGMVIFDDVPSQYESGEMKDNIIAAIDRYLRSARDEPISLVHEDEDEDEDTTELLDRELIESLYHEDEDTELDN